MPSLLESISVAGALVMAFYLLDRVLSLPHDRMEPPLVRPKIPLIGHVIGLLRYETSYCSQVAKDCGHAIFTLGVPRAKVYVVTSPGLITPCDRKYKILSFSPYVVEFCKRILGCSEHTVRLLSEDLPEENGVHGGLRAEAMNVMRRVLSPGEHLDAVLGAILRCTTRVMEPALGGEGDSAVPLFLWLRRSMTIAGTDALFGPKNPFWDPEVIDAFWAVEDQLTLLGLQVLPDMLAPEAIRGRKRLFRAFSEYHAAGGLETASYLLKERYELIQKYGVSPQDVEQFDLGTCTGLLASTVPAMGWTICHLFSDRALLAQLRQDIEAVVFPQGKPCNIVKTTVTVNTNKVAEAVPLLGSFVREVLRVQSNGASARFLLEDIVIGDGAGSSYLLKKGSYLAIPSARVHRDETLWGPTADAFDPTRFLPEKKRVPAFAWRAFGGGHALCPRRHLALREMVSILVVLVLRCDIEPCDEKGQWRIPDKMSHFATGILTPAHDIRVRIRRREELKYIKWDFVWEPVIENGTRQ